jgi:hypothetical protein
MHLGHLCARSLCIAVLVAILPSASLGIVGSVDGTSDFTDPSSNWYGMSMEGIAQARSGSAVAIGNRWFLSVRHFSLGVGNTMTLEDGTTVTVAEVNNLSVDGVGVDLRLIRVEEELDFWYDLYDGTASTGTDVVLAGTGYEGTTYSKGQFVYSTATGRDWRWGTNEITQYRSVTSGVYRSDCFQMNFNHNATEYEAGIGSGDSGSGVFAKDSDTGEWQLVGLNAYAGRRLYTYDTIYAVSLASYADWINGIMPSGDLDDNGVVDVADVDLLSAMILDVEGQPTPSGCDLFDMNADGIISQADKDYLIHTFLGTEFGDANLDSKVNMQDLATFEYGTTDASWANGDYDGDRIVTILDLGMLGENYGFDGSASIPEPATIGLLAAGTIALIRRKR